MINILVVDDHRLFRLGVAKMLPESKGFKVVGEAANAEQGVSLARKLRPNVVLMDILMRPCQKLRVCWAVRCSTGRTDYGKTRHTDQRRAA